MLTDELKKHRKFINQTYKQADERMDFTTWLVLLKTGRNFFQNEFYSVWNLVIPLSISAPSHFLEVIQ
jgi:hypothetical protein